MDIITQLFKLDITSLLIDFFIILSAAIAIYEIIGKFSKIIGKPVKWVRKNEEDHKLLMQTSQGLIELQKRHSADMERSDKHDEEIRKDIKKLTDIFIEKEIDDMRWEINNFANKVADGKRCNKDSYKHCLKTYHKYEKILNDNGLENGEVEISMELINESYKEKLKNGF